MELTEGRLVLSREPSELDKAVLRFTEILASQGIDYVIVSGYVVILTGRSRATEDVDVVLEPMNEAEVAELVATLEAEGYWGMAMPLDEMYSMLSSGNRLRIAEAGTMYPNFEVWFAANDIERMALADSLVAELPEGEINISPIELQLAYKLQLAQRAGALEGKDFEDALHLYHTFGEQLKEAALERYIDRLGVQEYYAELERA